MNILEIGNSFGFDSMAQSFNIIKTEGYEKIHQTAVHYPSCDVFRYVKFIDNDMTPFWVYRTDDGNWNESYPEGIEPAICEHEWDIVTLMPGIFDLYEPELFAENVKKLYEFVRSRVGDKPYFYWIMPWPIIAETGPDYPEQEDIIFRVLRKTTRENILPLGIFKDIIPTGTTVMNLRTTDMTPRLTRDTVHMSLPLGRYATALTYTAKILGKMPSELIFEDPGISKEDIAIIRKAADAAIKDPYTVTAL